MINTKDNKKNFINFSNHPSSGWGNKQRAAALELGTEIIDIPFPQVDPMATSEEIDALVKECVEKIMTHNPSTVMCQGEFRVACRTGIALKELGVLPVVGTTVRRSVESVDPTTGEVTKKLVFNFEKFASLL